MEKTELIKKRENVFNKIRKDFWNKQLNKLQTGESKLPEFIQRTIIRRAISINVGETYADREEQKRVRIILEDMMSRNRGIMQTIDLKILRPEIVEQLGVAKIERIATYPMLQEKIIGLSGEALQNFIYISNYNTTDFNERITHIDVSFCESIPHQKLLSLPEEQKLKLISIITSSSPFHLQDYTQLDEYYEKKRQNSERIIKNPGIIDEEYEKDLGKSGEISDISFVILQEMKELSDIERIKSAIIDLKYGMSYEKALTVCRIFGENIDKIEQTEEARIIQEIQSILHETDVEKLRSIDLNENDANYAATLNLFPNLKNLYLREYQKTLYQTNEDDFIGTQNVYLSKTKKHKQVEIYNAMGKNNDRCDFAMILTSIGGIYFLHHDYNDFKKDWDRQDENHTISASYIRNDFLGTVNDNYLLAFADIAENQLLESTNGDLGSVNAAYYDDMSDYCNNRFLVPSDQIDKSESYNEMLVERKIEQDGKLVNRKPTYAVFFTESIESINNNDNYRWEETKRMAAELGIPIVVIDCMQCAKIEYQKVQDMLVEFKQTKSPELISKILCKIENNKKRAGCGVPTDAMNAIFTDSNVKSCLETIISVLESSDTDTFNIGIDELIRVSQEMDTKIEEEQTSLEEEKENMYTKYIERLQILKRTRNALSKQQRMVPAENKEQAREGEEK